MVSELYLTSELTALSVIDRLHIYRGAIEELVWLKNLLSIPEKPAGPPTSKGSADIPVPDVGDVTTSRRPSDVTDRDKFLHRANSGGSGVSAGVYHTLAPVQPCISPMSSSLQLGEPRNKRCHLKPSHFWTPLVRCCGC